MSFRPPGYSNYYYSYVQNGIHRTVIIEERSTQDYYTNGYTNVNTNSYMNGSTAQQSFPNNVRIKFSAPPLKQRTVKKSYRFSKKFFVILLLLIVIFLFEKRSYVSNVFSNGNEWRQPDIPWKGPKEFDVDPNEFNNFEIIVSGRATQGELLVTRSSNNESSIKVETQILLSDETLQDKVEVHPHRGSSNYVLQVKTPEFCAFPNRILTNINITFPRSLKEFGKFSINVINLNINNDDLKDITFDNINWKSYPSIHVKNLKSRKISVNSRGRISGNCYIDDSLLLQTSNAPIDAITKSFSDSTPKSIKLLTSNAEIRGSFPSAHLFEAHTSSGGIDLNVTRASQNGRQNGGKIILDTSNGKIYGAYDVDSEWRASTNNGNINAKLNLVNSSELVRISGMTSNGNIGTLISDSYKGRFHLQTSNGQTAIKRSHDHISYNVNTYSLKSGYKRENNNNELSLYSSNGKIDLAFF